MPTRQAWQFTNAHEPLVLTEAPEPQPGPGEVLIDIKAADLCHSDVGVLEDEGGCEPWRSAPSRSATRWRGSSGVWELAGCCRVGGSCVRPNKPSF